MKTVKLEYVKEVMEGCLNDDYKSICKAGRLLNSLAEHSVDIDVEDPMKRVFKCSLYRKFMRAYSRYIINNPNAIIDIAVECGFSSMNEGRYGGINEY